MPKKPTEDYEQLSEYSRRNPGFKDDLEFDMSFELLGKKVTRKARIVYAHTPEWEYFEGAAMTDEPITGMYELLDAIEAVIGSPTGSQKGMHERAWRNKWPKTSSMKLCTRCSPSIS
jgi:hypothetical protein